MLREAEARRIEEHFGEPSDKGVQAALANLRAIGELQIVVVLADELDRRS
jgi:hypothetical protein